FLTPAAVGEPGEVFGRKADSPPGFNYSSALLVVPRNRIELCLVHGLLIGGVALFGAAVLGFCGTICAEVGGDFIEGGAGQLVLYQGVNISRAHEGKALEAGGVA